jgi:hypothetical protein
MNQQLTSEMQQHLQILHRYIAAMENGDIDALTAILTETEHDQTLERMILEINEVYQQEDQTKVQPDDTALVQQILHNALTMENTARTAETPIPSQNENEIPMGTTSFITLDTTPELEEELSTLQDQAPRTLATKKAPVQVLPAKKVIRPKWYRTRHTWLVAAVVTVLVALVFFPNSGVLASQIFSFFRVQQFQTVHITQQDIQTLTSRPIPSLEDLGSLQTQPGRLQTHDNLTETQAAQMVNFPILLPHYLPQGIPNNPDFAVIDGGHAAFTFNASQAHAYLMKNGYGDVSIPTNLDGATFEITTTPSVIIAYGDQTQTQFMVAEVPSPVITATGSASLEELRNFVLSLPGLPPQLVAQLRQIDLNSGVVPLPVPAGVDSQSVTVHGTTGLLLTSSVSTTISDIKKFPAGSAVVWQAQGIIYAIGGTVSDTNQLLKSANSLQ